MSASNAEPPGTKENIMQQKGRIVRKNSVTPAFYCNASIQEMKEEKRYNTAHAQSYVSAILGLMKAIEKAKNDEK